MGWRSSKPATPPPPPSTLSKLAPLIVFFIIVGFLAFIGLQVVKTAGQIADNAGKKLETKNVVFTKDGLKVGVKELKTERYVDKTQGILVKAWNLSTWPGYRSRFWNQQAQQPEARKSRTS